MKRKIYVASSWRNLYQPEVVRLLRKHHEVYDFRNPGDGKKGFSWADIDPDWLKWTPGQFVTALHTPIAAAGFANDWEAMEWADSCILVLPSGRSAHIEAGYFVGAKKPIWIFAPQVPEPELMYRMTNGIFTEFLPMLQAIS